MSESPIAEKKRVLRPAAMAQRKSLSRTDYFSSSRSIQGRVLQFSAFINCGSVVLYSPIQNEVATREIHDYALMAGKRVFYPRVDKENSAELVQVTSVTDFLVGRFGVLEPIGSASLLEQETSGLVVFVPGLVFDTRGNRLGRGIGWYDRLLMQLSKAISVGLAYDFQFIDEVPTEPWDQRVQYIITETREFDCRGTPLHSDHQNLYTSIGKGVL
jgi:5-formyltetrahydrofolate cyclo-ligase